MVPKAWENLSIDDKGLALYDYTYDSLTKLISSGVKVQMVQIGNETTGFFCGEKNWNSIAKLMNAGTNAV